MSNGGNDNPVIGLMQLFIGSIVVLAIYVALFGGETEKKILAWLMDNAPEIVLVLAILALIVGALLTLSRRS